MVGSLGWYGVFPDVLFAAAVFLALVLASVALAQSVADFVVWQGQAQSVSWAAWRNASAPDCCFPSGGFAGGVTPCSC